MTDKKDVGKMQDELNELKSEIQKKDDEIKEKEEEITSKDEKIEQYHERLLRLQADFDNFKKGDLIYDPFNGTGTTGVACSELGMKYIGSEISEKQCKHSIQRLKNSYSQLKLF